jgi:hypothetical protein
MLSLTEIPDFRHFLSSLLVMVSKNEMAGLNQITESGQTPWFERVPDGSRITKAPFWFEHLRHYSIASAEIHENFTYYAKVEMILENHQGCDVFSDLGFAIVNTNYGLMVLFFDETGSIGKMELNFRVEKPMPPFLFKLMKHFPNANPRVDLKIRGQIKKLGMLPIADYLRTFRRKRLATVEVD